MTETKAGTLLPAARVDVFSTKKNTLASAEKLFDDWRFARVVFDTEDGDIVQATTKYGDEASPDLVIIETEDIGDEFIDHLGALAANCVEGTDAIIIGPKNDVELYRKLVGMGVSDYLVHPVSEQTLSTVIGETLIRKKGMSQSKLIAVIGGKGGVGTTSVTQLLATTLSEKLKQKTLLLDAAAGWGTLGVGFGVEPQSTLRDVVDMAVKGSEDDLARFLTQLEDNLHVISSGGDRLLGGAIDADSFETLLGRVMPKYPVVIVDLSNANKLLQQRVLALASGIVLVSTPLLPSLRGTRSLLMELKELRGNQDAIHLVVNMRGVAPTHEVSDGDIKDSLSFTPEVVLPMDAKLFLGSEAQGMPVGKNKAGTGVLESLLPLCAALAGTTPKEAEAGAEGGILDRLMSKVKK